MKVTAKELYRSVPFGWGTHPITVPKGTLVKAADNIPEDTIGPHYWVEPWPDLDAAQRRNIEVVGILVDESEVEEA